MTFVESPSLGGRDAERPGVTPTRSVGVRCKSVGAKPTPIGDQAKRRMSAMGIVRVTWRCRSSIKSWTRRSPWWFPHSLPRSAWECRLDALRRVAEEGRA